MAPVCTQHPVQQRYKKPKTSSQCWQKADCSNEVRFCILQGNQEIMFNYKKRASLLIEYSASQMGMIHFTRLTWVQSRATQAVIPRLLFQARG